MERKTGHVKWFNAKKGYGFITTGATDVFVHHTSIHYEGYKYLVPGESVEFNITPVPNNAHKTMATNVTGIAGGPLMCAKN
jgi:CspA family cold shock protein